MWAFNFLRSMQNQSLQYVDGCFSFCFYDVIINFLKNKAKFFIGRQAFTSLQHGFLRSEENVILYNFETPEGVWENVLTYNILTLIFIKPLFKADVMPQCCTGTCYAWQMLLAMWDVADVITTEEDVISSYYLEVADVIANWCCGKCYTT